MFSKLYSNVINCKPILAFSRHLKSQNFETIVNKYVNQMSLKTCKNLYNSKGLQLKWYLRAVPKNGIECDVEYVDTKPEDTDVPTVVALHGVPGSHMDFTKLIEDFGHKYRVIVPNFPDFSLTDRTNCFWHSDEEKAEYLRDFLRKLSIDRIDCLVVHSGSIFPTSHLWLKDNELNNGLEIKSLCLLSTPGPKVPVLRGHRRVYQFVFFNLSRLQSIRSFLRNNWSKRMSNYMSKKRLSFGKIESYDTILLQMSSLRHSGHRTLEKRLKELVKRQLPTICFFSPNDKLLTDKKLIYDLYRILDTSDDNFDVYEEHQNILVQKARDDHWLKVIQISGGGHYLFITHHNIVHRYIEELIAKVCK